MTQPPSTRARNILMRQRDSVSIQNDISIQSTHVGTPRIHFKRSALCTALATSLVSVAPAALAETINTNITNASTSNQVAKTQSANNQTANNTSGALSDDDTQLDAALDALRLKKAVEQGIIDQSVLDDYSEQTLGIKKSGANSSSSQNDSARNNNHNSGLQDSNRFDEDMYVEGMQADLSNDDLLQQATAIQQQGYQMMTPEQIDRELAALDLQNTQDIDSINNDSAFDAPIATLNDTAPPIGLDVDLDATNLPMPSNLDTLGRSEAAAEQAATAEIMSRPINVSDSVSSGNVNAANGINDEIIAGNSDITDGGNMPSDVIDPEDYLPDYQNDTQAVNQSIEQADQSKPLARNKSNIVKRLYNRFFNGGVMALPSVETTVYIQQAGAEDTANGQPKLIKADDDF